MPKVVRICDDVFLVEGTSSNWVIVRERSNPTDFTLIDSGYRGDYQLLLESIGQIGLQPEHCKAVLVTHGHVDHIGGLVEFTRNFGTPVLCHARERVNLVGPGREQVTFRRILRYLWRPTVMGWLRMVIRMGGLKPVSIVPAAVFDDRDELSIPGTPTVVHCPGHTSGSSAFLFNVRGIRVVVSGDISVTDHELLKRGPRLQALPAMFSHDVPAAQKGPGTLLALSPDVIVPGHGPAMWLASRTDMV